MEHPSLPVPPSSTSETVSRDSIVQWSSRPVAAAVGQEIVLMNLDRGRCYGLGPTGTDLWQKMSKPIAVNQLLVQLEQEYDVGTQQLEQDVLSALQQYAEEGLIEIVHPSERKS